MELEKKHCVPCSGGTPPLLKKDIDKLLKELKTPWEVVASERLQKHFEFPDFKSGLKFVNDIGAIAENEGHHPDFCVHYSKVEIEIWTHAINGLSENDFILAAKIDEIN